MAISERLQIILDTVGAGGVVRDFDRVGRASRGVGADAAVGAKGLDRFSLAGSRAGLALKAGVVVGAAVAGRALVSFAGDAIAAASALEEQAAGAQVTFGDFSDEIVDFADKSSGALGLARSEALAAANAFGTFFKLAGVSAESAAEGAESLVRLAADLASRFDVLGGVPVVLEKLRSGLAGETEPLRAVGVFLNEAAIQAKAAELGLGGTNRQLTEGEKIAARYALIIEQTVDAQGDMERTSGSLANQQRKLSADVKRLQEELGAALVPVMADVVKATRDLLGGVQELGGRLGKVIGPIGDVASKLGDLEVAGIDAGDALKGPLGTGLLYIISPAAGVMKALIGMGDAADDGAEGWDALLDRLELGRTEMEATDDAVENLGESLFDLADAERARDDAVRDVTKAEEGLADARAAYNRLLAEGRVDEEKVADARERLASASRSVAGAERDAAKARREYEEAQAATLALGGLDTAREAEIDALDNLLDAEDRVADSKAQEREAVEDLQRAQAGDPDFNDKLADAKGRVADAEQDVADARFDLSKKTYELNEVSKEANTLLAENAAVVAGLRSEWDKLLALVPGIGEFLALPMSNLPGERSPVIAPVAPSPGAGLAAPGAPTFTPVMPSATPTGGGILSGVTEKHVTINVTQTDPSPTYLAREMLWALD